MNVLFVSVSNKNELKIVRNFTKDENLGQNDFNVFKKIVRLEFFAQFQVITRSFSSNLQTPPTPPTTCCMSGCANCVWLDYAEEMTQFYTKQGDGKVPKEDIIKQIEANVTDPMLKAFILLEVKSKLK